MKIQILGTGCAKCQLLEKNARQAIQELGITADIEKVTNIDDIMAMGVMVTPALAIDNDVKVVGKVVSKDHIKELIAR